MMADELVRAAAGGDEDAFAQLVALHEKKVYNLALRMCGNPEDAWDAAQEAFLSAWRGLPSFRGEAGFSTWLYRLTSNAAIDLLRRTRRQRGEASLDDENLGIDAVDRTPSPQEQAEASELRGLSYEEIAAVLEVDMGTVKSRISRARGALRKILQENGNLSGYLPSKPAETVGKGGGR